jgi:hypothetical protein
MTSTIGKLCRRLAERARRPIDAAMSRPDMSLAVVGAVHENKDRSNRLFEIRLCVPGEPVDLAPEPKNPFDPSAIAVWSTRGVQIGYLSAERCGWIGSRMAQGEEIRAIFQEATRGGAIIRISFSGADPVLPPARPREPEPRPFDEDSDFYPDYIPPDD